MYNISDKCLEFWRFGAFLAWVKAQTLKLVVVRSRAVFKIKLQPAICPLSQHVIRFHELPADTKQRFLQ